MSCDSRDEIQVPGGCLVFKMVVTTALLLAGSVAFAGDYSAANAAVKGWDPLLSEFFRSIDVWTIIVLVVLAVTVGLAVDALYHIRFSKLIPENLLGLVQEEMANGEYERALDVCLKSDSLVGQIFAAALAKTDYSLERMEGAMYREVEVLGLVWRQWVGRFRILAILGGMGGVTGMLVNVLRLVADLQGRPNFGIALASSFEMRALLYSIVASLLIGCLCFTLAIVVHQACRARLDRILLEAIRLGEELLDPFRPLPQAIDEE